MPKSINEKNEALFDEAIKLRHNHEYDKAIDIYRTLLQTSTREADAYWSIALNKLGITYIHGSKDEEYTPVINRLSTTLIFEEIADVVIVGIPDDFWGETVASAIIFKDGMSLDDETLRARLADKLAKYKIPSYFIHYDSFPALSNGKVDMVELKKDIIKKVSVIRREQVT